MSFRTPLDMRTMASHLTSSGIQPLRKDEKDHVLLAPLSYDVGELGSGENITIPAGFVTDLASVPRIFWTIIAPGGLHASASVLHDWMYRRADMREIYSRADVDRIFHEAMLVSGVPPLRARLMWLGVRVGGAHAYYRPGPAWVLTV